MSRNELFRANNHFQTSTYSSHTQAVFPSWFADEGAIDESEGEKLPGG